MTDPTRPPEFEEKPVPLWQKITAVVYVLAAAALIVTFRDRMHADFWPLDGSRVAPNILATVIQILLATPFAVLLWPPTRRRIHRFVSRHTAPLHARLEQVEQHHKAMHDEQLRHLQHIIQYHPDIPPLPEPGDELADDGTFPEPGGLPVDLGRRLRAEMRADDQQPRKKPGTKKTTATKKTAAVKKTPTRTRRKM